MKELNVGIIGCGLRVRNMFELMTKMKTGYKVNLVAIADPKDLDVLQGELTKAEIDWSNTHFYTDPDEMLEKETFDGVMIGTRCHLHTQMALKVLAKKIPLFLEKPVAINQEQWNQLREAAEKAESEVVVSFPLRLTPMIREVKDIIDRFEIGPIQHVAAFNYVTYGGDYYHSWYRDDSLTGGLFLQKSTHDFDYINYIVGMKPVEICAMNSKQIMKGEKPSGLKCEDCPDKRTCPEGPYQLINTTGDYPHGPYCCYAVDTGNEDSGTAIIRYENGMHVVYTQNFFVRNEKSAKRGAIISGVNGTVEFDWRNKYIKVWKQYIPGEMKYDVVSVGNHGGGDGKLVENFIGIMTGTEKSKTPLTQGLLSAHMCLKAKESAETHKFVNIDYFG